MKKTAILWIVLDLIFLIIFNAMFFILGGTEHGASVWISYAFIHLAYIMLVLTPILTRKGKSAAVFGLSIYSVSAGYFFVELLAGIIFILVAPQDYKGTLLTQLVIAGLYGIVLIAVLLANERTAEAEEKRQKQVVYIKDMAIRLKTVMDKLQDKGMKKKVEKLYDLMYSSPVKTHPDVAQIEEQIAQSVGEIERAAYDGDMKAVGSLAENLTDAVKERNVKLKNLN